MTELEQMGVDIAMNLTKAFAALDDTRHIIMKTEANFGEKESYCATSPLLIFLVIALFNFYIIEVFAQLFKTARMVLSGDKYRVITTNDDGSKKTEEYNMQEEKREMHCTTKWWRRVIFCTCVVPEAAQLFWIFQIGTQ